MVKIDVLEKVTEPTEWVNSFVIVEKVIDSSNAHSPNHVIKKSIRLCIDPKDLNEALEREPYYSRSIDELISMFAGAKVFTIVDMDKGYWQVVLHPESRKLTCMAFDIGRYQFKRLPMGSKVASDIFQRMLDSVYIGLPGVTGIADDMVIFGRNEEEHDRNLILFLETTRKNGLVLNKKKLQFNVTRSIDVTSACSSFLTGGHETKKLSEFHQISKLWDFQPLAAKPMAKYHLV